jgi:hypothetical protein
LGELSGFVEHARPALSALITVDERSCATVPLRNRVTPLGGLVADPARGLVYGNRGCLHNVRGEIVRRFQVKRWIACRLEFKGWHRGPLMQPGRFTELFFLDEATAFAAGHRPCALCRRADYDRFLAVVGERCADDIDERLHAERLAPHRRVPLAALPDGAFVLQDDEPWLVLGDELRRWTPAGYLERIGRGTRRATVVTPPSLVDVLRSGWSGAVPLLHSSAQ